MKVAHRPGRRPDPGEWGTLAYLRGEMSRSVETSSAGDLDSGSVQQRLPPTGVLDERQSWLAHTVDSLFIMENEHIPLPQGGPQIKYFLQEGMCRKGSLLAKASGPI